MVWNITSGGDQVSILHNWSPSSDSTLPEYLKTDSRDCSDRCHWIPRDPVGVFRAITGSVMLPASCSIAVASLRTKLVKHLPVVLKLHDTCKHLPVISLLSLTFPSLTGYFAGCWAGARHMGREKACTRPGHLKGTRSALR